MHKCWSPGWWINRTQHPTKPSPLMSFARARMALRATTSADATNPTAKGIVGAQKSAKTDGKIVHCKWFVRNIKVQSKVETWQIRSNSSHFGDHKNITTHCEWMKSVSGSRTTYFIVSMEFGHIFIALAVQLKNCLDFQLKLLN